MIQIVILWIYLLGVPLIVTWLAGRFTIVQKISPMVILYIIGLCVGNLIPLTPPLTAHCQGISNVSVLLSIPLLLLGCDFRQWSLRSTAKLFLTGLCSVVIVTIAGFFIFAPQAEVAAMPREDFVRVSAAMVGIYTGGIPNFAPVARAVALPDSLFLLVSSYDLMVSSGYLLFIIFFGKRILRRFFAEQPTTKMDTSTTATAAPTAVQAPLRQQVRHTTKAIGIAAGVVGAAYLLDRCLPMEDNTAIIILLITTFSLVISLLKPLSGKGESFNAGLYFVYLFCLTIATQVNVRELALTQHLFLLYYIAFAIFGSLFVQILLAKALRIKGELILASSMALINSPPFVPMVAALTGEKEVILPGIAVGLLGYAVGNYLGIALYALLL